MSHTPHPNYVWPLTMSNLGIACSKIYQRRHKREITTEYESIFNILGLRHQVSPYFPEWLVRLQRHMRPHWLQSSWLEMLGLSAMRWPKQADFLRVTKVSQIFQVMKTWYCEKGSSINKVTQFWIIFDNPFPLSRSLELRLINCCPFIIQNLGVIYGKPHAVYNP